MASSGGKSLAVGHISSFQIGPKYNPRFYTQQFYDEVL